MDFGLNTFLLTARFTDRDTSLFDRVAAWGFDAVEIVVQEDTDVNPEHLKRELDRTGLRCCSVCGIFPPDRDLRGEPKQQEAAEQHIRSLIRIAPKLDARVVCGPFYSTVGRTEAYDEAEKRRQHEAVAERLRPLCKEAEKVSVVLAMEPLNRFETDMINTCDQGLRMIEAVGSPALKLHLDTFHMNIEEKDPPGAIRKAGDRLGHLHFSGSDRGAPGRDHLDWRGIFRALKETGYKGAAVIESFTSDVKAIARAAAIWRDIEPSSEVLARDGLTFLRTIEKEVLS